MTVFNHNIYNENNTPIKTPVTVAKKPIVNPVKKKILTIHDLIHEKFNNYYHFNQKLF